MDARTDAAAVSNKPVKRCTPAKRTAFWQQTGAAIAKQHNAQIAWCGSRPGTDPCKSPQRRLSQEKSYLDVGKILYRLTPLFP